jgi:hypothetical protein
MRLLVSFLKNSLLIGITAWLAACGGGGGSGGSDDPTASDWFNYSNQVSIIESAYLGLPTRINLEPIWFNSLNVKPQHFTTRNDSFSVTGSPAKYAVGYGSFASLEIGRRIVFYSNWAVGIPSSGSAFALEYVNDVPTSLDYLPIEGSTHSWVLDNQDGSQSVVFVGVDEGKLTPSPDTQATSPSYFYNLNTKSWSTSSFISDSHNSIPFDYDSDGNEDIVAQGWSEPFGGAPFILRNDNGIFTPLKLGDLFSGATVAPFGFQSDGNFWLFVGDDNVSNFLSDIGIPKDRNYIQKIKPDLSTVVGVIELPIPYFEAPIFGSILNVFGDDHRSHDVSSKILDLDYDGDLDIIVSSLLWSNENPYSVLQILINNNGTFIDETESRLYNWFLPGSGQHRLDFRDVNGDGHIDILSSDHGDINLPPLISGDPLPPIATGSKVLVNDGTGHFVTVIHQQINEIPEFLPSFIPSLNSDNKLRWTMIDHINATANGGGGSLIPITTRILNMALSTGPNMTDPSIRGAAGFNEFYYLLQNPDVVTAIQNGEYETGLDHYLAIGQGEGRPAAAPPPP